MEQQGWKYDPEQTRKLAGGLQGRELEIIYSKNYVSSYTSAVVVQAMLQAAGINSACR